jgi:hypothetical protein
MSMRWLPVTFLAVGLLFDGAALAKPGTSELVARLRSGGDFRVRVQAALQLGRSEQIKAVAPLVDALDDPHASVRAAAAAGLKMLGDPRALGALKQHRLDPSDPVRAQVHDAIAALEVERDEPEVKPKVFVKLGDVRNGTSVKSPAIEKTILTQSRKNLDELPGIEVLPNDDEVVAAAEEQDIPVVMVTTSIQKLSASREGNSIVYSANIEYLVHSMPDQVIAARVAGSASTSASEKDAKDKAKSAALRREVVEAAVKSALARASAALIAAARL